MHDGDSTANLNAVDAKGIAVRNSADLKGTMNVQDSCEHVTKV